MALKYNLPAPSKSKSPNTNEYFSSDIFLCAFLKTKGLRLLEVRKAGGKSVFVFFDREDRKALIQEFFNDGMVRMSDFKNAVSDLKTLLFSV